MNDFYDLAQRRKAEIDVIRLNLHVAETEMLRLREELVEADREIKALHDELEYAHQEMDDLQRQANDSSSPAALPVSAGDGPNHLRDVKSPRRPNPPSLQPRGAPMTWPEHDG